MADDQQQSGAGAVPLPSAVQGMQGAEANALQLKIKNSICKTVQSKVDCILQDVEKLTDIEKLYLYLKLPSGPSSGNEKNEQSSMSSSRTQQLHAFSWIRNHLEEHPETSLPKQEVYDEYKSYCDSLGYHALSAADFGKIMKNVFPNMKARRLGMRGKSKYCYSGLRKKAFVHMPSLPNLDLHKSGDACEVFEHTGQLSSAEDEVRMAACGLVCEWAQKVLSRQFDSVEDLARFLLNSHYIGTKSVAALTVMTGSPSGAKLSIQSSAFAPTTDAHSFQPQVKTLVSPSVDAKQQLQRKIQKKQQEQKLHSPLPGEAQARRADGGITPGVGTGIPCGSPALLSPQPIGIVVAAVSSPITVQRSRQLLSPSPVPMGAADSKVLPVNFQMVTQSVQPVKQCPKTPRNISASPISDRSARHRYAQILPKPSASSGITLRSPTLLITNSPIKTVMSTPHVSSVNVVKMTTISLGSNGSGISTPADTPASNKVRPASAGVASLNDDPQPVTRVRSGSIAAMPSILARSGRSTSTIPAIDTKTNTEAIIGSGQEHGGTSRLATLDTVCGVQRSGIFKPRVASIHTPLDKGSLGLDTLTGTKCNERTLLSVNTLAAGSNNMSNTNKSTLYQNTNSTQSNSGNAVVTSPKDAVLASKSPHKRPGLCTDLSPTPVKKAHISVLPAGGSDGLKSNVMVKQIPRSSTPIRPESAPLTATGKATACLVRNTGFQTVRRPQSISQGRWQGASSVRDYRVSVTSTASQDTSVRNTMFQTVCRPRSISQGRWEGSSTGVEVRAVVTRTVSAPGQALLQQVTKNSQDLLIDQSDSSAACELKSVFWDSELQHGTQQHQEVYGLQMVSEPKQMSTPVMEPLPAIARASPSNQQAQMSDYGTQANLSYFPFDDDMTQDSIVEELVQMEEQMKINNSIQSFSNCVDNSLQGQQQTMQTTMMSSLQTNTLYYSSAHSSSTPIQTPTPTPTPTSEMIGSGHGMMHESPCSRLAPTTPVDSALGSSRQTPIGTPHSNCSSSIPPSPVECRNPFAFTPINSSITGYHDGSTVSSSPVKPMQRPMATHPDKTKLEWMNSGYSNSGGNTNNGISILPTYQDLVDDHFRKPHAFAIPGQTCQSQTRHHDTHISRLTPISPVQQQVASMASLNKKEGFAVPAPLDNRASSGSGTFRCRSVSPAVRQRNLSGTQNPNVPHSVVSPFNSPVTPEVLNIFSNSDPDASISSMAQRSQSVPVTVMMQSEVLPMQAGQQMNTKNITNVLINKMDGDGDDSVRGIGINNMPSNYTARMNLTQILETTTVLSFPGSASHQALISPCSSAFESQKPGYLMKNAREELMSFSVDESQAQSASGEHQPPQQQQHLGRRQLLGQGQQSQAMLLPLQQNLQQHQHQQPLDLDRTVKDLLHEESLNAGSQLVGQGSELSAGSSEFPSDMRLTSELTGSINDLNTLDTNLLFDPSQQQGQYEDSTLEELKNDPLFQQICSETVNSAGFDWLESKDQATVEMLG
ncbi:DNA-binding protein RFX7-like [Sinocyclocheilus rhinocerous]|uniref:DNA-binding protein RFX7-like n=1 Tax=Sinocyclocheilus rhinocerous TaxID=307959 RepID=UPI0007B9E7B9|nr:PREDICTED: DNA-binding protein RFX7-like [Sinocyclocheilus rhinocerous]